MQPFFPKKSWDDLPGWARCGWARQLRWDGGPVFAACQVESRWAYLSEPDSAGFVGLPKALWVLPNLYSDDPEERLRLLSEAGYNWLWVTWFLGYSPEDQELQYRIVRPYIRRMHARGMAATAYFSLTSMFRKSLFSALPEAETWQQRHADGRPILYAGIEDWPMGCVNNPGWMGYLREHLRLAVEAGADDVFWDSIFNRCYCDYCRIDFRRFSRQRYGREFSPPGETQRVVAGEAISETYLDVAPSDEDPAHALFTEFSHYTVANAIHALDTHAKSLRPAVLTSANSHRMRYVDEVCDIVWCEDAQHLMPRIEAGRRISAVPIHKWCWSVSRGKKPIAEGMQFRWQVQEPDDYRLAVAEAAAFQGAYAPLGSYHFGVRLFTGDPKPAAALQAIGEYQRFLADQEHLYAEVDTVANVAVYHSHASRDRLRASGQLKSASPVREEGWWSAVSALFDANILHDLLEDSAFVQADAGTLAARYTALVLSGVRCLSDAERRQLLTYTSQGGTLVLLGPAGTHNEFWEPRPDDLAAYLQEFGAPSGKDPSREGRVLPLPEDGASLAAALQAALGADLPLQAAAPPHLAVNLVTASAGKIGVLHLVNYDPRHPARDVTLRIKPRFLPALLPARAGSGVRAVLRSPEHEERPLPAQWTADGLSLRVPEVRIYEVVEIT